MTQLKKKSWIQMKTSWIKLKRVRRMITINFQFVLFCFHRFIILNSFWVEKWKYHLRIVFESCHKMFLNTSKLSDHFYHWINFAQTKQSDVKTGTKKGEKIRFSAFLSCQVTEKQSSYPRKGLADPWNWRSSSAFFS